MWETNLLGLVARSESPAVCQTCLFKPISNQKILTLSLATIRIIQSISRKRKFTNVFVLTSQLTNTVRLD